MGAAAHERALGLAEAGDAEAAIAVLREHLAGAVDPEAVNDLAVLLAQRGEAQAARELLAGLLRLAPDYAPARENLAALADAAGAPADMAEARARFLQLVAEAAAVRLPDNLDPFAHPFGQQPPDPQRTGERIAGFLAVLDRCDVFWRRAGDERSRDLLLRLFAYRALGPAHVRLELEPDAYRAAVHGLTMRALREPAVLDVAGRPLEWHFHRYDLEPLGFPVRVIGQQLPLTSTFVLSQYAHRDPAVGARPRPGDVAVDAGGCWGETALWLACLVGPTGAVHTFEPTPANRAILERNLALNPDLAARIAVHAAPLAARPGERVRLPDVVSAGARMADADAPAPAGRPTVELATAAIDDLVAAGTLPRVDFLKVDVEGADLGVLQGAAETIRRDRPRLALACYHDVDDLAVLPAFVESLGVPYRWYLQCSTMADVDIVAFGVPAED
jgi:FkbM family methyltransferase